jgi:hypothetical protein
LSRDSTGGDAFAGVAGHRAASRCPVALQLLDVSASRMPAKALVCAIVVRHQNITGNDVFVIWQPDETLCNENKVEPKKHMN